MRKPPCRRLLPGGLLCLAALATLPAGAADSDPAALPAWQVLEYEQQAFFVTARSRIEVVADSADPQRWQLTASSAVANNSEEVVLELAADGSARHRARLSRGKSNEQRYKTYEYLPEHILRVRRDPPTGAVAQPPGEWPVSNRRKIAYPHGADGLPVTDAYALLLLAARFLTSPGAAADVVVNTEFNFYLVRMSRSDGRPVQASYEVAGGSASTGKRLTRGVTLTVSPLGEQVDKPDFSLLGLGGEITILFDEEYVLPLQLHGTAPRIGPAEINLTRVTLRDPAA